MSIKINFPRFTFFKKLLLSLFVGLVLLSFSSVARAVTTANLGVLNNTALTNQQKIYQMYVLLKEISKEVERITAERQKALTSNPAGALSNTNPVTSSVGTGSAFSSPAGGAGAGMTNLPFGGLTGTPIRCTCFGDYSLIPITPAKPDLPMFIMYSPSKAITYEFGEVPKPGIQVLGTHGVDLPCLVAGHICTPVGAGKDVIMIGTSGSGSTGTTRPQPPTNPAPPPTNPPPASDLCAKDTVGGWNFNPGIQNQIGDASESLKSMLYCMCNSLSQKNIVGRITSISDGKHIGRLNECRNPSTYSQCGSSASGNCCYHSLNSCHYGGNSNEPKSYGADFGMTNANDIMSAARQCGAGYVANEGNHIHVSTADCRSEN